MELQCGSAVNCRRYCRPTISNSQIGVFVSAVNTYHYIPFSLNPLEQFWPLARQIKEQMDDGILKETIPLIRIMKFVSDWNKFLLEERKLLPNGCQHSIGISNILQWSIDIDKNLLKGLRIVDGGFTQAANIVGGVFDFSIVTVNDVLSVYFSFQGAIVKDFEQAKNLRDTMRTLLLQIVSLN